MILLSLIESFERYIKEVAAVCADHVVPLVVDNAERLHELRVQPSNLAAHFKTQTLGRALCEGDTWLDCESITKRFRRLLAKPFTKGGFEFFPKQTTSDLLRIRTIEALWQLRHSLAHNIGMITLSDAAKLRLLVKADVAAPRMLTPTDADVWYAKNYLDETAEWANARVAQVVAALLTDLHASDPNLFQPQPRADQLAREFRVPVTVAGATGTP